MSRLEDYVFEAYAERIFSRSDEPTIDRDDSEALAAVEDAKQALSEVEEVKSQLRPVAYAQALDAALADVEAAESQLASLQTRIEISAQDALPLLAEELARVPGGRVLEGLNEDGMKLLRHALSREIQAVFVRPAASRSKSLPIEDRVNIVWAEDEELELPTRGERFEPRAYAW
jgi:hypothetical protein